MSGRKDQPLALEAIRAIPLKGNVWWALFVAIVLIIFGALAKRKDKGNGS